MRACVYEICGEWGREGERKRKVGRGGGISWGTGGVSGGFWHLSRNPRGEGGRGGGQRRKGWWVWIFVMGEVPCEGGGKGSDGAEGLFCSVDVGNTHGRIHGS